MAKLDLTRLYRAFYTSPTEPNVVDVPKANFLTIVGRGAPGGEVFQRKLEALYRVAYAVKFKAKAAGKDYVVCKLEGLWWFDDPTAADVPREEWNWKLMIRQPEFVTREMVEEAKLEVKAKKKMAEAPEVEFEAYEEGLSAQIMHIGPYEDESATIARLHKFIREGGYEMRGLHHEIYLTDIRRAEPEKWRTIVRQPIRRGKEEAKHG
ncbi:MAG: GyrI-like domain-containing protein [Anaerolineae bacterium]